MSRQTSYSPAFEAFAAERSAAAIQQQEALNGFLGSEHRSADLDARTLRGGGLTIGGVTSLGSFSHLSQTWLWTWANQNFDWEHPAVAPVRAIHEHGLRHDIPELTAGHLDLAGFPDPHQAATTMAIAAGHLLGGNGIWSCAINEGKGAAYVHLDDPQLPAAGFDPDSAPRLLMTAVQVFPGDHRRVVRGYFERHDAPYEETTERIAGGPQGGGRISVGFDTDGRLDRVSAEVA
ncbi:hypothetical protein GCM10010191_78080 [Actinomadura vinacea]|uniref:Uncharacterized protein n=1 Tax=Actinomadura vinacea TaxID=115336 RepID=A0ABP5X8Z6_9ACTN